MLSRRLLRIKVLQSLYACRLNTDLNENPLSLLFQIINKSYELYLQLLLLPLEMRQLEILTIEKRKEKYLPKDNEINPNLKFVNNSVLNIFSKNPRLQILKKSNTDLWNKNDRFLFKSTEQLKKLFFFKNIWQVKILVLIPIRIFLLIFI